MILLEKIELANGLQLAFYDRSRVLAGDRWRVELQARAVYPLAAGVPAPPPEPDAALREAIRVRLGDKLEFTVCRTRNFVDQGDKEEVLAGLLLAVKEHMLHYFVAPTFPARLFRDNWRRIREECLQQIRMEQAAGSGADDEDEGPADFSALFK